MLSWLSEVGRSLQCFIHGLSQVAHLNANDCLCHAGTKSELRSMFDEGKIIQFADFYNVGHGSTNYKKWFTASEPYPITYKTGYEPYVLVDRRTVPWYDDRFRGYGWDKVRPTKVLLSDPVNSVTKESRLQQGAPEQSRPLCARFYLMRTAHQATQYTSPNVKSPWCGSRRTM